jgi:hypothetical protein
MGWAWTRAAEGVARPGGIRATWASCAVSAAPDLAARAGAGGERAVGLAAGVEIWMHCAEVALVNRSVIVLAKEGLQFGSGRHGPARRPRAEATADGKPSPGTRGARDRGAPGLPVTASAQLWLGRLHAWHR